MTNQFQDMDLAAHSLYVSHIHNLLLFQDLYRNFFPSQNMDTKLNLAEGAFAKGFICISNQLPRR